MAYTESNKFNAKTSWGDSDSSLGTETSNSEHIQDFKQDSSGIPNPDRGEKTSMDMNLAPNKFPRETGHDSLSAEEAQLS